MFTHVVAPEVTPHCGRRSRGPANSQNRGVEDLHRYVPWCCSGNWRKNPQRRVMKVDTLANDKKKKKLSLRHGFTRCICKNTTLRENSPIRVSVKESETCFFIIIIVEACRKRSDGAQWAQGLWFISTNVHNYWKGFYSMHLLLPNPLTHTNTRTHTYKHTIPPSSPPEKDF